MAHVFYPEASDSRCTVAMLLEIDPVGFIRRQGKTLREYVNDRPYAASSFLSVAISRVLGTAMRGKRTRNQAIPRPKRVRPGRGGPGEIRPPRTAHRVHECVFGVLALESEPVDPRL